METPADEPLTDFSVVPEEPAKPPVTFERAKRMFTTALSATQENDADCLRDAAFYHGDQLDSETRKDLKNRKQPPIVINRLQPAIDGMLGVIDGTATQPEAYPNDPDHQDQADICTKVLRSLAEQAHLSRIKHIYSEDYFVYGTTAVMVGEGAKHGDKKFNVRVILWEDFFADPLSRDNDFEDARYMGVARWCDADEIEQQYPVAYEQLGNPFSSWTLWDNKDTAERLNVWIDAERKRIRIVELYMKDQRGQWHKLVFCESGFLDFGLSPYQDDDGNSVCPIVATTYKVNRLDLCRYGPIRRAIDAQNEYNARRSKMLHVTNSRQVQITNDDADPMNRDLARSEAAKPDGVMPLGYEPIPTQDLFEGNAQLLQIADKDFDRFFPTPAILSQFRNGDSGRAMQVLQNAGLTDWARSIERLHTLEKLIYHRLWWCARQFYTAEDFVRVTNEARAPEFCRINVPVVQPQMVPITDPATGQHLGMQLQSKVVAVKNELAKMDVDIHLSTSPKTESLQQEVYTELMNYASALRMSPLDPQFEMLLELTPLPNKTQIMERMKAKRAEIQQEVAQQQAQQMQAAQQAAALEAAQAQAKIQKEGAQAQKASAEAQQTELETMAMAHTASRYLKSFPSQVFGGGVPIQPPQAPPVGPQNGS